MATYPKNSTWPKIKSSRSGISLSAPGVFDRCSAVMASCVEREINALLWLSLIGVTAYLLRKLLKVFGLWAKAGTIPGPSWASFFSHRHLFSGSSLNDILYKCHEKYGGVVKLWLGPTQLLVSIEDRELIKDALLKAKDKLPLTGKAFSLAFGKSSFFVSSFDKVERKRNSVAMKLGGMLLERISLLPEEILDRFIERTQCATAKGGVDMQIISLHLAFTILGATIFGNAFLMWPRAAVYEELLMEIGRDACFWASYGIIPFWKKEFWKYKDSCTKLKCLTEELLQESRQNCKSEFVPDFGSHDDTEYEPCGEIISLMFHGSLTMGALIANVFTRLVTHPDIEDKIHSQEARNGPDLQVVDMNCPILLATIYESARLLPAGPLLQRRSLKRDLTLKNGMVIPAAAMIVVPIQLVQTDTSNWGIDAGKFNPHRFLLSTGDDCISTHLTHDGHTLCALKDPSELEAYLPFGYGARACIGQKLAILGISSLFSALIARYKVTLEAGSECNAKPTINNCMLQLHPSPKIVFVKRSPVLGK